MISLRKTIWMAWSALVLCAGCQYKTIDNSMVTAPTEPVSFSEDVLPIFLSSCGGSGCHIDERTSGVNLSNYAQVINSVGIQYNGLIVISEDGANSPLVDKLVAQPQMGTQMPLGRTPLSNDQIALIRTWIDEGAENN